MYKRDSQSKGEEDNVKDSQPDKGEKDHEKEKQ